MILTTDQRVKLRLAELEILVLDQQRIIEELQAPPSNNPMPTAAELQAVKDNQDGITGFAAL